MIAPIIAPIPPYKALIFDCDGTLADTLPVHFQTWSTSLGSIPILQEGKRMGSLFATIARE